MRIEQDIELAASIDRAWAFLTDLPAVSQCVPDVSAVEVVDDQTVAGTIKVKVGPIALQLAGQVRIVEQDAAAHRAALEIQASDRRIGGGVNARTTFQLVPAGDDVTRLTVATEATLLGRLGQFGQPIIRRKSDEMARQFATNVARTLAAG